MTHHYTFRVEDVTCEKCDARIHAALASLPGAQHIEYVRTPSDEAEITFVSSEDVPRHVIEEAIAAKSTGTTHTYRVHWTPAS
jgi:copper chaperone CopZ